MPPRRRIERGVRHAGARLVPRGEPRIFQRFAREYVHSFEEAFMRGEKKARQPMTPPLFIRLNNQDGNTRYIRASTITELQIDEMVGDVFNLSLHTGERWENVAGFKTRKEAEHAVQQFLDMLEGRAEPTLTLPPPLEEVYPDPLRMHGPTYRLPRPRTKKKPRLRKS